MVRVRTFEARDVTPANALTNWYIEHTNIHFGYAPATDAQFQATWQDGSGRHPWLAAEVDGRFAGYAKASTWRARDAYANTCETGIYVARDCQGHGVGNALYVELLERLRAGGFHTVVAGITLPNEPSVRLHEKLGFVKVAHFQEVGRKNNAWHDVGFWQRPLEPGSH